jgi:hypothetical protein
MKKLFAREYIDCFLDEETSLLFHVWLRKPTSAEFRDGLLSVAKEFTDYKTKTGKRLNWLGDTRNVGVLSIEDQGWLDKVWNETLFVKAGVKNHAVIIGTDVFAKYAMEKFKNNMITKYAGHNLHLETFENKEAADKWFATLAQS